MSTLLVLKANSTYISTRIKVSRRVSTTAGEGGGGVFTFMKAHRYCPFALKKIIWK
jgi:hypothetical protein